MMHKLVIWKEVTSAEKIPSWDTAVKHFHDYWLLGDRLACCWWVIPWASIPECHRKACWASQRNQWVGGILPWGAVHHLLPTGSFPVLISILTSFEDQQWCGVSHINYFLPKVAFWKWCFVTAVEIQDRK